jgi:hypothetical protein
VATTGWAWRDISGALPGPAPEPWSSPSSPSAATPAASHGRWSLWPPIPAAPCDRRRCPTPGPLPAGCGCDLAGGDRLHARLSGRRLWPRRAFGALGPAHALPGLSQYWHPWLLGAHVEGEARVGGAEIDLAGAVAYAEKNWGAGGMPDTWWWGQAHGFDRADACVAFAGGRAGVGGLRATAGALVVALGGDVHTVVRPPWPLRVGVDERGWRLRGGGVEVEAHVDGAPPHLLPVPVPRERRRLDAWAAQHLTGVLSVKVRRRGRTLYAGTSRLAGLERGRGHHTEI